MRQGPRRALHLSPLAGRAQAAFGRRSWRKERRCEASAMERSERVRGPSTSWIHGELPLTPPLSAEVGYIQLRPVNKWPNSRKPEFGCKRAEGADRVCGVSLSRLRM